MRLQFGYSNHEFSCRSAGLGATVKEDVELGPGASMLYWEIRASASRFAQVTYWLLCLTVGNDPRCDVEKEVDCWRRRRSVVGVGKDVREHHSD